MAKLKTIKFKQGGDVIDIDVPAGGSGGFELVFLGDSGHTPSGETGVVHIIDNILVNAKALLLVASYTQGNNGSEYAKQSTILPLTTHLERNRHPSGIKVGDLIIFDGMIWIDPEIPHGEISLVFTGVFETHCLGVYAIL